MATKIVNECCDCAVPGYPCQGEYCSRRRVTRYFCDRCDPYCENPLSFVHEVDGVMLCDICMDDLYGD